MKMAVGVTLAVWILLATNVLTLRRPLVHLEDNDARNLFCNQTYFDSLSFDGQVFRFTGTRIAKFGNIFEENSDSRIIFDEFLLKFHPDSNSFSYHFYKYDLDNVVPRGGFYIDQLGLSIEFYVKRHPIKVFNLDPNLFRCRQTQQPNQTLFKCSDFSSQTDDCKINLNGSEYYLLKSKCLQRDSIQLFPSNLDVYLEKFWNIAFVYDPTTEKPMYIFTNRSDSFMMSSIWIIQHSPIWMKKQISPLSIHSGYRFKGGFQWKTALGTNRIYLLAEHQRQFDLIELIDSKKFLISKQKKSWRIFFGCEPHLGAWESEYSMINHPSGQPRYNVMVIYISLLGGTILVCSVIFVAWNLVSRYGSPFKSGF